MTIGIDVRLWNQTGVGRYIRNLVQNLEIIDKKNSYVLFARDEDKVKIKSSNFKTVSVNIPWHSFAEQFELINILSSENVDLIHFPYYSVPIFYRKPFVVTIHDLIPLHFQTGKASTLPLPLYKFKFFAYKMTVSAAVKNAEKIIAPSEFSKRDISDLLKIQPSKINVVYEGVDKGLISLKESTKKEHFLYIGNAYPHKNLEFLLEVFKDSDQKLILVGKDDYFYKKLEKRAQKLNLTNVKFFGYAKDSELRELYKKAKALIIPSFIEGFGLPTLEAMANKCIVLASDIPTLREIGKNAAFYFDPKDKEGLKKLLDRVQTNDKELQENIKKGLKRVEEFSWRKTTEQTLQIYEQA